MERLTFVGKPKTNRDCSAEIPIQRPSDVPTTFNNSPSMAEMRVLQWQSRYKCAYQMLFIFCLKQANTTYTSSPRTPPKLSSSTVCPSWRHGKSSNYFRVVFWRTHAKAPRPCTTIARSRAEELNKLPPDCLNRKQNC
jgi:hypothetical protein